MVVGTLVKVTEEVETVQGEGEQPPTFPCKTEGNPTMMADEADRGCARVN